MSRVDVQSSFWISLAISVVLIPLRWVIAWVTAACIHELCHVLLLKIFRCQLLSFRISAYGARIVCEPHSDVSAIISTGAGVAGSFMLVLIAPVFPRLAICGFLQGVFNLLPLYPMDGWHILQHFRMRFDGVVCRIVITLIRVTVSIVLLGLGAFLLMHNIGPVPFIIAVTVFFKDAKNTLQKPREEGTIMLLK